MADVSEKMIEVGCNAGGLNFNNRLCRKMVAAIYTAMHSAREVDAERVAVAIYTVTFPDREAVRWIGLHWHAKEHYRKMANAAITAMGEKNVPTGTINSQLNMVNPS